MFQKDMDDDAVEMVVAEIHESGCAWLQAADVIVAQHWTRWSARRWTKSIRRQFPGCAVAVSRSRHGRWLVLGWATGDLLLRVGRFDAVRAAGVGRQVFRFWAAGGKGQP